MDMEFFLKQRTKFIRRFYVDAVSPFFEKVRKIEEGEPPYEPPYSQDDEPPFMEEWIESHEAIQLVGRTCVSMLSDSLKLYFGSWERELGCHNREKHKSLFKKRGFVAGYQACFQELTASDWELGPFDLKVIEQVVLARNDSQHPSHLTSVGSKHRLSLAAGFRQLFFAKAPDLDWIAEEGSLGWGIMTPNLDISQDKLFEAIDQVENLAEWLEPLLFQVKYPQSRLAL